MRSRKVTFALDKSFMLKRRDGKKYRGGLSPLNLVRGEVHTEAREACCWKRVLRFRPVLTSLVLDGCKNGRSVLCAVEDSDCHYSHPHHLF